MKIFNIRRKTVVVMVIGLSLALGVSTIVTTIVLNRQFAALEKDRSQSNVERVVEAYRVEIDNMDTKLSDWSVWDDTYEFIGDRNEEFKVSNLTVNSLQNLKINSMIFMDEKGEIIHHLSINLADGSISSTSALLLSELTSHRGNFIMTNTDDKRIGVIQVDHKPVLIAARPVFHSDGSGPARGTIFFTRNFDADQVKRLSDITKIDLHVHGVSDALDGHERESLAKISNTDVLIEEETASKMIGYFVEYDLYGNPGIIFTINLPRDINTQRIRTNTYITGFALVNGFLFILFIVVILDRLILYPMSKLAIEVGDVARMHDIKKRLYVRKSGDEIDGVTESINTLMDSIEQGQAMLAQERLKMQTYLDSAGVMILALDTDGKITLVNKRACQILGVSESSLIGTDWISYIPEESRGAVADVFGRLKAGQIDGTEYAENMILTQSGEVRLIGWHNSIVRNADNAVTAILSSGDDITERKRSESYLEQKNHELESTKMAMLNILEDEKLLEDQVTSQRDQANSIISTMSEGLFVVDRNFIVQIVNKAALDLLGQSEADVIGKKLNDITTQYNGAEKIQPEDQPLWKTIHTGESFTFGLEANHYLEGVKGKIPVAISTSPLRHGDAITGGLVTFHDITKDKTEKEIIEKTVVDRTRELQGEKARLLASINSLNIGYILLDRNFQIILTNQKSQTLFDMPNAGSWNLEELDGKIGGGFSVRSHCEESVHNKISHILHALPVRNRIVNIIFAPVLLPGVSEEVNVIGSLILIEDVTERKIMERSKDEFFSIASHELRTPLTAIRGNTSMIQDFYGDTLKSDPELEEMIRDIHASSIRLIDIVNDFLNVSRLEQGKIDFKKTRFNVQDLVKESIAEFDGSSREKKVSIRFGENDGLPDVLADRDRTKQVILNLVGNALKFTQSGDILVRLDKADQMIRFSITDSGRGISKENQNLLFHKFQQAGSSLFTRDTTGGTGLGLYISKLIVEGIGGKIWLDHSEEGRGSTFCFTLPIA